MYCKQFIKQLIGEQKKYFAEDRLEFTEHYYLHFFIFAYLIPRWPNQTMAVFIKIFVLLLCFSSTFSIEEAFCAGTGYSNLHVEGLGLRSVGYHYVNSHPLATIWAANHISSSPSLSPDSVEFVLKLVEQKLPTGTTVQLNGWLLVEVNKWSGNFMALALWAATDTREPIGEFLTLTGAQGCPSWKQAREILPCSAVPIDASRNPNMFVYTGKQSGNVNTVKIFWKMSTAHCNKPKKFRFYAAASTSAWTDNTPPFYVKEGDSSKLGPIIYTTTWIEPKFFGAASPVFDTPSIQCTKDIYNGGPIWLEGSSNALKTIQPEPKWLLPRWKTDGTEDLKVAREIATCKAAEDGYVHHGGRCTGKVNDAKRVYAGSNILQTCNHVAGNFNAEDLKLFTGSHTDKLFDVEKYLKSECLCPTVPTPAEVKGLVTLMKLRISSGPKNRQADLKKYQDKVEDDSILTMDDDDIQDSNNMTSGGIYSFRRPWNSTTTTDEPDYSRSRIDEFDRNKDEAHFTCALQHKNFSNYNSLGLCVDSTAGKIVYGVRQWHATATLLCTVVLVPIASYMARYHKGTLPIAQSGAAHIPVRVWYIVHILIILPILCLYTTGMVAVRRQRSVLGYSLTYYAEFHRIGGTVVIALMVFQILTGFLRPLNMFYRKLAIWVHFIIGLLINYGGLVICILTYRIPGSPTASHPHVDSHLFKPMRKHIVPMILTFWGVADLAYQAFITVHVMHFDKSVGVRRPYFPVIIPILVDNRTQFDDEYEKEHSFQKGTLTAYIIFSIFIFFVTCISMYYLIDDRGQGFGPMFCTHDDDGNFFDPTEPGNLRSKRGHCI